MKRILPVLTIVLMLLLNVTDMSAKKLVLINVTSSPINFTAYFKQGSASCRDSVAYSQLQAGDIYSKDITGCLVKQIIIDFLGQGEGIYADIDPAQSLDGGIFVVQLANPDQPYSNKYVLKGPYFDSPGKMLLINTTGNDMPITFGFNNKPSVTRNAPARRATLVNLDFAESGVYYIYGQGDLADKKSGTNVWFFPGSRGNSGIFVFKQDPVNRHYFTMTGPLVVE